MTYEWSIPAFVAGKVCPCHRAQSNQAVAGSEPQIRNRVDRRRRAFGHRRVAWLLVESPQSAADKKPAIDTDQPVLTDPFKPMLPPVRKVVNDVDLGSHPAAGAGGERRHWHRRGQRNARAARPALGPKQQRTERNRLCSCGAAARLEERRRYRDDQGGGPNRSRRQDRSDRTRPNEALTPRAPESRPPPVTPAYRGSRSGASRRIHAHQPRRQYALAPGERINRADGRAEGRERRTGGL